LTIFDLAEWNDGYKGEDGNGPPKAWDAHANIMADGRNIDFSFIAVSPIKITRKLAFAFYVTKNAKTLEGGPI
jgi:hypothetical protein